MIDCYITSNEQYRWNGHTDRCFHCYKVKERYELHRKHFRFNGIDVLVSWSVNVFSS